MSRINPGIAGQLTDFSRAFNSNDVAEAAKYVIDDFVWIYYEGSDGPEGRVIHGIEAACAAVAERASRLSRAIAFTESREYQCDQRVFVTYRASGAFRDSGAFDVRAIDIYTFRNDRLASKDTYWKNITR